MLQEQNHRTNGLWYIPKTDRTTTKEFITQNDEKFFAWVTHQSTSMEETIKLLHQCLFSPTINTLLLQFTMAVNWISSQHIETSMKIPT